MSKKKPAKHTIGLIVLAGILYWGFHVFQHTPNSLSTPLSAEPMNEKETKPAIDGMEIPADLRQRNGKILVHKGYTVSFNAAWNLPYWSAWTLTSSRTYGNNKRYDKFLPDPLLPSANAVETSDYAGSGYDRGHLCPAADNKWNSQAMKECFYLSNICPQEPNLNRGDWKELEDKCRDLVREGHTLYIAAGPLFTSAAGKHIGKKHKIAVPDGFFKVILMEKNGGQHHALGFLYKNSAQNFPMEKHVVSVDEVEKLTGFDFFYKLPDAQEKTLESSRSTSAWGF